MFKYKDYYGQVEYDEKEEAFVGEVINTQDVILFKGKSVNELQESFKAVVENYLKDCERRDKVPDKPFSGKFNLRLSPVLHRAAHISARREHVSLNSWIANLILQHSYLGDDELMVQEEQTPYERTGE